MHKYLLTGILSISILTLHSCFAKRRKSQPAAPYITAKDDTIPEPLPLMDSLNTKFIGTWEASLIQNRKLFIPSHRQPLFSGSIGKIEFTDRKECIVTKPGQAPDSYKFFANNQNIILNNGGCTGSVEQPYKWLNDSTIEFRVMDEISLDTFQLIYRKSIQ